MHSKNGGDIIVYEEMKCPNCFSENVFFSKKFNIFCCEDCGMKFEHKHKIISQRVFISYGHDKNREIVNIIKNKLKERGHNPWIDSAEIAPGNDWRRKIESGICESDKFLAFISKYSVRKPGVCLDEIAIALGIRQCHIQSIILEKDISAPNSISSIQWLDFSEWENKKSLGGLVWDKWLESKLNCLFEIIENPENIKKSGELIEIKKNLKPILPDEKIRFLLENKLVQRKWLLEKLSSLMENDIRVLCLIGGPGTGKSIYCALLSNYLNNVAATYFIDWQNKDSQKTENFVISIAFQMSCNLADYRYELLRILPYINIETCSVETLCEQLLIEPINRLIDGGRSKTLIIVDALDELKQNVQKEFIDVIELLISTTPDWISWLFTSRQNEYVIRCFDRFGNIQLDLFEDNIYDDLNEYIDLYISDEQLKLIILKKCEGSFFFAKELIEAVNTKTISVSEIEKIPNGIANIYEKNFNRLIGDIYDKNKRDILSVIMFAYENITIDEIADLLSIKYEEIRSFLVVLESYIRILKKDAKEFVYVVHKSVSDWVKSDKKSRFFLDEIKAHKLFSDAFLDKIKRQDNINKYLCFYGYEHSVQAKIWVTTPFKYKKLILEKCIEACKEYGNLYYERKFIELYCSDNYDKLSGCLYLLDLSIRTNEEINTELINNLVMMSNQESNDKSQYLIREKIAIALFYLGKDDEAYKILIKEREEKQKMFEINNDISATWNHTISLVTHDIDLNEDTINTSLSSAEMFFKQDKTYEYLVSLVNLFDAYMGSGDLKKSHFYAEKVAKLCDEKYYVHVVDIY